MNKVIVIYYQYKEEFVVMPSSSVLPSPTFKSQFGLQKKLLFCQRNLVIIRLWAPETSLSVSGRVAQSSQTTSWRMHCSYFRNYMYLLIVVLETSLLGHFCMGSADTLANTFRYFSKLLWSRSQGKVPQLLFIYLDISFLYSCYEIWHFKFWKVHYFYAKFNFSVKDLYDNKV